MYCSQCSHEIRPSDRFCPNCAAPTGEFQFEGDIPQVEPLETPTVVSKRPWPLPTSSNSFWVALVAVFGVVTAVTLFGLFLGLEYWKGNSANQNTNSNQSSPASATPTPASVSPTPEPKPKTQIVNDQFPVEAGKFTYYRFSSDSAINVSGGFVAYGGSNDIDVYLVDEENFGFVAKGDEADSYYHSGYTQKGKVNKTLPPGIYYLVFDNRKAWFTGKSVAAEFYYQEQ